MSDVKDPAVVAALVYVEKMRKEKRALIDALLHTLSPRPEVWYKLVEKLVADGFRFDHSRAEWRKVGQCDCKGIVGRISFTETEAWLTHRNEGFERNGTSHHVKEGE